MSDTSKIGCPMSFIAEFQSRLPARVRKKFLSLKTPFAIQNYLDSMPYIGSERDRSPLNVMLDGQCHCLDGGFLATLTLWKIGFKPLLIDLVPEPGKDDDHVLALYQIDGRWGAVANSHCRIWGRCPKDRGGGIMPLSQRIRTILVAS